MHSGATSLSGLEEYLTYVRQKLVRVPPLDDLDPDQRERFIEHFCDVVYQEPAERRSRQQHLTRALTQSETLADLSRSPLLLGLCCLLGHEELPRRRHQFYRRAIELLDGPRPAAEQPPGREEAAAMPDLEDKVRLLRELALHLYPAMEIDEPALLSFARAYLKEDEGLAAEVAEARARALLDAALTRRGVLASAEAGPEGRTRVSFSHRGFLSYLTAEALRARFAGRGIEEIDLRAIFAGRIERWDQLDAEVIELLCALLGADRPALVMELLQEMLPDTPPDHGFLPRAVRCLAEVRQIGREPLRSFALGLMSLIQHESSSMAAAGPAPLASALDDSPEARLRLLTTVQDPDVRLTLLQKLPPKMTSTRYLVLSDLLAELPERHPLREAVQDQLQSLRLRAALRRVGRPHRHRRRGVVSVAGRRVGLIEETPTGSRFTYEPLYLAWPGAEPISLTLPLRPEPYETQGLHPFFENLLPEGWLLDLAVHDRKIDRADRFGLLLLTCADCVGAAEIRPVAEDEP